MHKVRCSNLRLAHELLESLRLGFNRRRQTSIDEELFDVISGFEALSRSADTCSKCGPNSAFTCATHKG